MATRLGRLFLTAAMGPVSYAGRCIMARKVKAGLSELTGSCLMGAVERGLAAVAKEVGLPPAYIGQMLPMTQLRVLLERIDDNQRLALEQWDLHTGHIGGLLDGVADLTVDGRQPEVSLCLLRLSRKMRMDKALAEPLRTLSDELDRWQQLMHHCRTLIDDGGALKDAYRRRRMLQIAAAVVSLLVLALGSFWLYGLYAARQRVAKILSADDPCGVHSLNDDDVSKASSEQTNAIGQLRTRCKKLRAEEKRRADEVRAAAEAKAKREREAKARLERCAALGQALKQGGTTAAAALKADGETSDLVRRIATAALLSKDYTEGVELPCKGTPAGDTVEVAYARAVMAARPFWLGKRLLSQAAFDMLVKHTPALSAREVSILGWASEDRAKRAVSSGSEEELTRGAQLCTLSQKMGIQLQSECVTTLALAQAKKP